MTVWRRLLLVIFSTGWLLPIWWVEDTRIGLAAHKAAPGYAPPPDLMIFLHGGRSIFALGVIWLALVIGYWIWTASRKV